MSISNVILRLGERSSGTALIQASNCWMKNATLLSKRYKKLVLFSLCFEDYSLICWVLQPIQAQHDYRCSQALISSAVQSFYRPQAHTAPRPTGLGPPISLIGPLAQKQCDSLAKIIILHKWVSRVKKHFVNKHYTAGFCLNLELFQFFCKLVSGWVNAKNLTRFLRST